MHFYLFLLLFVNLKIFTILLILNLHNVNKQYKKQVLLLQYRDPAIEPFLKPVLKIFDSKILPTDGPTNRPTDGQSNVPVIRSQIGINPVFLKESLKIRLITQV